MRISGLVLNCGLLCTAIAPVIAQSRIDFNKEKVGEPPRYFTPALTGEGRAGVWVVTIDEDAPAQGRVLAQTDVDATGYRFPICFYEKWSVKNADIRVKFKTISGAKDQAAGLLWRYRDADNYYMVRANALEQNVVLYKMQGGKRESLSPIGPGNAYGRKAQVPAKQWNTLRVIVCDDLFSVYLNGAKLFDVKDATFPAAGNIGFWTKADSVTFFDDLEMKVM